MDQGVKFNREERQGKNELGKSFRETESEYAASYEAEHITRNNPIMTVIALYLSYLGGKVLSSFL